MKKPARKQGVTLNLNVKPLLTRGPLHKSAHKNKSAVSIAQNRRFCYSFYLHRSVSKRLAVRPCTRPDRRFVFRRLSAESSLRSAPSLTNQTVCTRRYGAVRFLLWWLFLHRRLRSRQRGLTIR